MSTDKVVDLLLGLGMEVLELVHGTTGQEENRRSYFEDIQSVCLSSSYEPLGLFVILKSEIIKLSTKFIIHM